MNTKWHFWIDRGGTFTDIVARSPETKLISKKLLSENATLYSDAAVAGIRAIFEEYEGLAPDAPFPADRIAVIKMGTTVATNALLTRGGEPALLAITQGHADALSIGSQARPRLFDLHIKKPHLLYANVVEIPERMSAHGETLRPLDETESRRRLAAAYAGGLRSIAVVLMHGYRFAAHERRVAELAREIGFTQISVSHVVNPLMKLVPRGDTTVADAYLSPVLRRYISQVNAQIEGGGGRTRLMFMQSSGGLTQAAHFHGKDAVLSGPAGGVVGAAETARTAGFDRIIGFDMGGTSTDVCHVADAGYERTSESTVAGVRLRAPMMLIHTVAAGGGSLLIFDGLRFRVGPESAGADPGPACYGKGGPLTVTDANLLLGKIDPTKFPQVFGPGGDQPLDIAVVRTKFADLAEAVEAATHQPWTAEKLAEGFIALAVDNMARAIRKISVERGFDVTAYTLACFGGAGGQHACLVADALGMPRIYIHPLAGVLSAYGIGLAVLRVIKECAVETAVDDAAVAAALADLEADARASLVAQGVPEDKIAVQRRLRVRYAGTDTALAIAYDSPPRMTGAFVASHKSQFGFLMEGRALICEAAVVEASEIAPPASAPRLEGDLAPGAAIEGPAVLSGALATTVIEPGWRCTGQANGGLVLDRISARAQDITDGKADPLRIEIFNNLFMSIAEQMGAVLQNTAQSVNIKERLDFSCALFDENANLIANAPHIPVHLGSMGESVRAVMRRHGDMKDGDVFVLNNPYDGGTHLPDITVVTPVFLPGEPRPRFYVASRGHHADIGGTTPGSMPPLSRTLGEEGVLIDNLVLVKGGIFQEAGLRAVLTAPPCPVRNVEMNLADLRAQAAANAKGAAELRRIAAELGPDTVVAYMGHVQDHAEEAARRVIATLTPGSFTCPLDDGGAVKVAVTIDRPNRTATIDFTGTSAQRSNNFNAPSAICRAAVLYVFRTLIADEIPLNEGVLRPLKLIIPPGSMLNPRFPAAVVAGNVETSQIICDALYGALGVLAASQGTMNNLTFGNARHQYYETIAGGSGAGDGFDGASAVQTHMTNSRLTDPEVLEWRYPVTVEEFSIRAGSGGTGRHTGGNGVRRLIRFHEAMTAAILSGRRTTAPFGLHGGGGGLAGETVITRADATVQTLGATAEAAVEPGDVVTVLTPGGGGYGRA
jgi:5-oxoprolinase (ATP-hydrolysing)